MHVVQLTLRVSGCVRQPLGDTDYPNGQYVPVIGPAPIDVCDNLDRAVTPARLVYRSLVLHLHTALKQMCTGRIENTARHDLTRYRSVVGM